MCRKGFRYSIGRIKYSWAGAVLEHHLVRVILQPADKSMPTAFNFPSREPTNIIQPVYTAVVSKSVDHHQARLLRRCFLKQDIVASHIDAEDDPIIEQVLPEFIEVRQKFLHRVTLFEVPPQRPGNSAIIIRDQIDDKTFSQISFLLPVILRDVFEVLHVASRQIFVQDEFTSGLFIALSYLDLDYLARIFRVQVAGALLANPDRFAGNLQYLLIHAVEKDITN